MSKRASGCAKIDWANLLFQAVNMLNISIENIESEETKTAIKNYIQKKNKNIDLSDFDNIYQEYCSNFNHYEEESLEDVINPKEVCLENTIPSNLNIRNDIINEDNYYSENFDNDYNVQNYEFTQQHCNDYNVPNDSYFSENFTYEEPFYNTTTQEPTYFSENVNNEYIENNEFAEEFAENNNTSIIQEPMQVIDLNDYVASNYNNYDSFENDFNYEMGDLNNNFNEESVDFNIKDLNNNYIENEQYLADIVTECFENIKHQNICIQDLLTDVINKVNEHNKTVLEKIESKATNDLKQVDELNKYLEFNNSVIHTLNNVSFRSNILLILMIFSMIFNFYKLF